MNLLALPAILIAQEEMPVVEIDNICYSISLEEKKASLTGGSEASGF